VDTYTHGHADSVLVRRWPRLTEVTVPAGHFVPEDAPDQLGRALANWMRGLDQG
jgi:pimeloyl-ACP methyl ester carboxylesterase